IQNWAQGMSATLTSDHDIGDGKTSQDVTGSVQADGTGSVAVSPPSSGAFNPGTFNYTLTVTPQSGDPVKSSVAITVGAAAAQTASASLQIGDGAAEVATDYEAPVTLTWKVAGAASAQLSTAQPTGGTTFEGTTGDGGKVRLAVNLGSAMPYRVTMSEGNTPIETWEFELAPPDEPSAQPA